VYPLNYILGLKGFVFGAAQDCYPLQLESMLLTTKKSIESEDDGCQDYIDFSHSLLYFEF
jgi:hypothetical protein